MDEKSIKDSKDLVAFWKERIQKQERAHAEFYKRAEKAQKQYDNGADFNILWSNAQITLGALFSNRPNPDVRRRQRGAIGPQKAAAQLIERAIDFVVDSTDFEGEFERVVMNYVVAGLGVPRVRYQAKIGSEEVLDPLTGEVMPIEVIEDQEMWIEYIPWKNFHWEPSRSWKKCGWIAFDYEKPAKEVMKEYEVEAEEDEEIEDGNKLVKVTEIWDRDHRRVVVICEQFDKPLAVDDDPLSLQDFYPVPKALMANVTEKLTPSPDYHYYEKQARALDRITRANDRLAESIKSVGFYDAAFTELQMAPNKTDGALIPVEGISQILGENPNVDKVVAMLPIDHAMKVLEARERYAERKKQQIYEIVGLSDIMRGATSASETAEAQSLKAQFGSVRLSGKQSAVAMCVRDIFRIFAEIIGEHFEPDILSKMTGVEASEEVMAILRDDLMRNFTINVETDSTIARDEAQEQQQRMQGLETMTKYITSILPAMNTGQMPFEVGKELLLMAIKGFKHVGNLDDLISQMDGSDMVMQLQQQLAQMQAQMQEMQKELGKHEQAETMETMAEARKTTAEAIGQEIENQQMMGPMQPVVGPVLPGPMGVVR